LSFLVAERAGVFRQLLLLVAVAGIQEYSWFGASNTGWFVGAILLFGTGSVRHPFEIG